jgi:uncharacterized protein YndB with AHSA1/START domain
MSIRDAVARRAVIRRRLAAPRERVFRAWTAAEHLQRWFFPTVPDEASPQAEVDLRVGGRYRITMRTPAGDIAAMVGGTYYEIQPPAKLVFSWAWEAPDPDASETLVTVEFHDIQGETEITITHQLFPDPTSERKRTIGWICALERLTQLVEARPAARLAVAHGDPCRR